MTYQYRREDGTEFEYIQSMKDDALTHCPETGQKVVRVITGGTTPIMKGPGFHKNDYSPSLEAYKRNPHLTTLDHYQKKIDANTQKARELRQGN